MVFSSAIFILLFLPIVFILNWIFRKKGSNILLLIASLVFYAWGEPVMVLLMIASIVINWAAGFAISRTDGAIKRLILILGVVCDLGILGYYKYAGFFASTFNSIFGQDIIPALQIALPIGISFFTFQAISYIADVYRGETEGSKSIINVALYISFFPQLIAGPIVKYRDINKQIESRHMTWQMCADGFRRFIYGLGKKVLIANVLGLCVDTIYSYDIAVIDTLAAWIAALVYTLQIYYDFSGYSDMAIGLGKMFGFNIMENFNYPYMSRSVSEFWRRWHISLGSWFREYVYIPLGGNRISSARTYLNLAIVFLLTGLWHGADLSFIIWGLFHGFFAIIERLGFRKALEKTRVISVIYTDLVAIFGWVLFRSGNTLLGLGMMSRMVMPWKYAQISTPLGGYLDIKTIVVFVIAVLGMGILKTAVPQKLKDRWRSSAPEAIYCMIILGLCIASIASDTYNPFIYFQF